MSDQSAQTTDSCTMAVPRIRATVEATGNPDFCEIVSQVLAVNVFRTSVLVTPGLLWHYADVPLTCRLRYRNTRYRMTVRNSVPACRWLFHLASGWHSEAPLAEDVPGNGVRYLVLPSSGSHGLPFAEGRARPGTTVVEIRISDPLGNERRVVRSVRLPAR
jgi:hypothetical protein